MINTTICTYITYINNSKLLYKKIKQSKISQLRELSQLSETPITNFWFIAFNLSLKKLSLAYVHSFL